MGADAMRTVRASLRTAVIVPLLLAAVADGQLRRRLGLLTPGPQGAVWVHHWCRRIVRAVGIRCVVDGPLPDAGAGRLAVVSNHVSYLDVLLYSSIRPFLMVSKTEVRGWPLIGWITAQAGTIYVQRAGIEGGQTQTHAEVNAQMAAAFRSGLPVLFFPEGTTSDGSGILPFRRGLYNSVVYDEVPMKVAALRYEVRDEGASVARDVCFIGDDAFGPHLFGLLGLRDVRVSVAFSAEPVHGKDRFALAANSRLTMLKMWEGLAAVEETAPMQPAQDLFDRPVDGFAPVYGDGGVRG